VSGVQDKINLVKANSGYCLGTKFEPTDLIIKFEREKTPCIPINELFTMTLAGLSGVDVPDIAFKRLNNIANVEVSRFDRVREPKTQVVLRRHVIDGCQATNLPPTFKYERQFGDDGDGRLYRDGVCFRKPMKIETQDDDHGKNRLKKRDR
jgi:serine/threonine-protein kinase HipA